MTGENLALLRKEMKKRRIDVYVMSVTDYHASEYIGDHFKEIAFLTGFTGENSYVLVTQKDAFIWADGRYFLQCEREIAGSGFKMVKMGVEGQPKLEEKIKEELKTGMTLGFDGKLTSEADCRKYEEIARNNGSKVKIEYNLIDPLWKDRPALPAEKVWIVPPKYSGKTVKNKLRDILDELKSKGSDAFLLTSLYDIAWLLNLRGNDIPNVPVFMSYMYITRRKAVLYIQDKALDTKIKAYLKKNQITVKKYEQIYKDLPKEKAESVILDANIVNAALVRLLPKKTRLVECRNMTEVKKAIKNDAEIKNTKKAHIEDGVAVTKFIHYIKTYIGKEELDEMDAADILLLYRKEREHFLDVSFDTIAAYRANAAMMHYSATPDNFAVLKPEGFLLVDSGGHYMEGTTDITRTIALGPLTDREKEAYTLTLKAYLRLLDAKFLKGASGIGLDILARGVMWERGLDYRCGTGHGVGHINNVHEGPNGFRYKADPAYPVEPLVPGMITTDEPGLYYDGELGVRIESELLCVEDERTEYGQFLRFENLTYAPLEPEAIIIEMLDDHEKELVNEYHEKCRKVLGPYLTDEENEWLKKETAPI